MIADWTPKYFSSLYGEVYSGPLLKAEETAAEVKFLKRTLQPNQDDLLLDVGCGFGRHAQLMIGDSHRVIGLDRSINLLGRWPRQSRCCIQADMRRQPFGNGTFNAAWCLFNTFGYFSHKENGVVLRELARVLKPEGKLILQIPNRPVMGEIVREYRPRQTSTENFIQYEEYEYDGRKRVLVGRGLWSIQDRSQSWEFVLRLYSHEEFLRLAIQSGFEIEATYDDFDSEAFNPNESSQMILVLHPIDK